MAKKSMSPVKIAGIMAQAVMKKHSPKEGSPEEEASESKKQEKEEVNEDDPVAGIKKVLKPLDKLKVRKMSEE